MVSMNAPEVSRHPANQARWKLERGRDVIVASEPRARCADRVTHGHDHLWLLAREPQHQIDEMHTAPLHHRVAADVGPPALGQLLQSPVEILAVERIYVTQFAPGNRAPQPSVERSRAQDQV